MADIPGKPGEIGSAAAGSPDGTDVPDNCSARAIAERLAVAVRAIGGNEKAVSRAKVSSRTLTRALAAQSVKRGTLLDLAYALRLPPNWLLEGVGTFNPEWVNPTQVGTRFSDGSIVEQGPPMRLPSAASAPDAAPIRPPREGAMDPHVLAKVLEVIDVLAATSGERQSYIDRARRILAAYETLTAPEAELPPLPQIVPRNPPEKP